MNKFIVTTTINPVTEAIVKFQALKDWQLVVVGDLKTPQDYHLVNGTFLSPQQQEGIDKELSDLVGWNCIQRRNFGLLYAYQKGADVVAVVDDDNVPLPHWGKDLLVGSEAEVHFYDCHEPAFDPLGATNHGNLWHRGFPLQFISSRKYAPPKRKKVRVDVQADFWNLDPDIDAVCRMEHAPECQFQDGYFPMASNAMSPFNSQNTFLSRAVLKNYFLFPHVGRMDDIWAAFFAQSQGASVVYNKASVNQYRNRHDFTEDMKAEYLGYEYNHKIVKDIKFLKSVLPEKSAQAFARYQTHFKG